MQPDAGQFDQVSGLEPVTCSRHGNEFADNKIAEHPGMRFIVEAQRH
jgi:hypothetical protein